MNIIGILYPLGAAVIWGLVYTLDQKILLKLSPMNLIFMNSLLNIIFILPFFVLDPSASKPFFSLDKNTFYLIVVVQAMSMSAAFLILSGIKILGAPLVSSFEISYPFFVAIFSLFLLGGSLNLYFWLGSLLIFAGSMIIVKFG